MENVRIKPSQCLDLNNKEPLEAGPAQSWNHFVEEGPFEVGAESLEPDRTEPGDQVGGQQDVGESHGHELRRPAFENAAEVDLSGAVRVVRQVDRCHCSSMGGEMGGC